MATKYQALRAIELVGGSVDWNVSEITSTEKVITVDAPAGLCWSSSGSSCFCISWYSGPASEFWDEVIEKVRFGLEVC